MWVIKLILNLQFILSIKINVIRYHLPNSLISTLCPRFLNENRLSTLKITYPNPT